MLSKLIFLIGWIGIWVITLIGLTIAWMPEYAEYLKFSELNFRLILGGVSLFYFALFLKKLFLIFSRNDGAYKVKTESGDISISYSSVNNLIKEMSKEEDFVKNVANVVSRQSGSKLTITLYIDIITVEDISSRLISLQERIKDELLTQLKIEVKRVDINTKKISINKKELMKIDSTIVKEALVVEDEEVDQDD